MLIANFVEKLRAVNEPGVNYDFLIETLEEDMTRPLAMFIEKNPKSGIPFLICQFPDSGLLQLVEKDITNPMIYEIEKNPRSIKDIGTNNPELEKFVIRSQKRMRNEIIELGKDVFKVMNQDPIYIHKDEYFKNFHKMFRGDELSKEDYVKVRQSWLSITRSGSTGVRIVDDAGDVLFVHPGLFGELLLDGKMNSWENFTRYSKINQNKMGGMKEKYQADYIDKFSEFLDKSKHEVNKENVHMLLSINHFFDNYELNTPMSKYDVLNEPASNKVVVKEEIVPKTIDRPTHDDEWILDD